MIGTFGMRMTLALLAAAAMTQPTIAQAAIVEGAGLALGMLEEIAIVGGLLAALYLIDKASWAFMTGGRHKR